MPTLGKVAESASYKCVAHRSLVGDDSEPIFGKVTLEAVAKSASQSCLQPCVAAYDSFSILRPRESIRAFSRIVEVGKAGAEQGYAPHPLSAPCYTGPSLRRPTRSAWTWQATRCLRWPAG